MANALDGIMGADGNSQVGAGGGSGQALVAANNPVNMNPNATALFDPNATPAANPPGADPNTFSQNGVNDTGAFLPGQTVINHDTLGAQWPVQFDPVNHDPFGNATTGSGLYG